MSQLMNGLVVQGDDLVVDGGAATLRPQYISQLPSALIDAATILVNAAAGDVFVGILAGNRTMGAPSGLTAKSAGRVLTFVIAQDAVGGRTLAWNAIYRQAWSDTGNTAAKICLVSFYVYLPTLLLMIGQGPYV